MEQWVHTNLSQILDYPVTEDLVQYVLQIQDERDLDGFLMSFLDCTNAKHRQFIIELKKQHASIKDQIGYKKVNDTENGTKKQCDKKKGKVKGKECKENKQAQEIQKAEKVEKKKTKFVNLYSQEGIERRTVLLKGRHKCDCEAKTHALINNCLNCGRIICIQEGAGPCFFCGDLVCSLKDQGILSSNTKQADQLYNKLMNQKPSKSLEESIKQRDKLLECDRNVLQCTTVIDDQCDYYQSNNTWLTPKVREKLKKMEDEINKKKHMSRLNRKIKLDFTGREVIEEDSADLLTNFNEEEFQDISDTISEITSNNICPSIEFNRPVYIESQESEVRSSTTSKPLIGKNIIQDKEYLEMSDIGVCLSMHQPYASLLVAGIKTHEGRVWYTAHRGRLWIAATSKTPSQEEIKNIEHSYRVLKNEKIIFPETYPTSCLLGCVTVTDVLNQEQYRKSYPDGESDSPYVFICNNFCELPIKFPIQGKHKIYKLDKKVHYAAMKMLEKTVGKVN